MSGGSSSKKRQRGSGGGKGHDLGDDEWDLYEDTGGGGGGDLGGSEVEIVDEFGRHRTVTRGGPEHREHLQAKKRAAEMKAEQESQQKAAAATAAAPGGSSSFDDRYSYRGNRGAAPTPSHYGPSSSSAATAAPGGAPVGGWAWSSGTGRGADAGDFETREGQERRAKKDMTELLEREGAGEAGNGDGGAKASPSCLIFVLFLVWH